jgi:hypothetical protein
LLAWVSFSFASFWLNGQSPSKQEPCDERNEAGETLVMSKISSYEIRLASRPKGMPAAANFALAQTELEPLQDEAEAESETAGQPFKRV